ncbi:outer membrane protein (porin) [Burkholderiales bacterium JOSHI_001]|nr:outer membrane protein (porin) [Burkholderiales bacterium JOSHI_001]
MKKVLAFSALALAALSANAQLSIYGLLDGSYGKSIADDATGRKADFHSGGDDGSSQGNSTSRIGFKGSYDIGSGTKANFKLETGGIGSDGRVNQGGTFFNRQAWFGMSGSWGEVRFGRQDSLPFQVMAGYDQNGASNGVSAWAYSTVGPWGPTRDRQSKALNYISPAFGGLTAQLGLTLKGNDANAKDTYSVGLTYATGPFSASLVHESKRTQTGDDFTSVAGSYDFGVAKISAGYADASDNNKGVSLGVSTKLAGLTLGAQYSKNTKGLKDEAVELFVNKEVFKNTYGYFEVGHAKNNAVANNKGTGYAAGLIFVF